MAEGAVLGDPDQPNHLAYEHLKCGTRELVLLLRFVERREGKAYFIVVDEIEPTVASHQQLMGISMCSPTNEAEGNVIAIGTLSRVTERELRAYDLAFAWRLDLNAAKIRPTAVTEVSCGWRNVD